MAQVSRGRRLMGDINVVPYIDVMLVLLIIFMITAPLLTQGIKVDLPKAGAEPLDPEMLKSRLEKRSLLAAVLPAARKARYWELYAEMFVGLSQRSADGFPHVYTEAFAKAFEAKLRAALPPRRSAFGPDPAEHDGAQAAGEQ